MCKNKTQYIKFDIRRSLASEWKKYFCIHFFNETNLHTDGMRDTCSLPFNVMFRGSSYHGQLAGVCVCLHLIRCAWTLLYNNVDLQTCLHKQEVIFKVEFQ